MRLGLTVLLASLLFIGCGDDDGSGKTSAAGSGGSGGAAGSAGTGGSAGSAGTGGAAGSAGTGGSAGQAGEAGAAGTGGTAGMAGAGGTAGVGGSAGMGGAAGEGGSGGTPPSPEIIAANLDNPWSLALGDQNVFVTDSGGLMTLGDSKLLSIPKAGGPPTVLAYDGEYHYPVFYEGDVFFLSLDVVNGDASILTLPESGATSSIVYSTSLDVSALNLNADGLFFTSDTSLMRVDFDGQNLTELATGLGSSTLAADESTVYVADNTNFAILSIPSAGGSLTQLATSEAYLLDLAVDDGHVYYGDKESWQAQVRRVATGGGTPETVATFDGSVQAIATNGTWVFFTGVSTILRAPVSGGTAESYVDGVSNPQSMAMDDTHLYWADQGDGNVGRVAF